MSVVGKCSISWHYYANEIIILTCFRGGNHGIRSGSLSRSLQRPQRSSSGALLLRIPYIYLNAYGVFSVYQWPRWKKNTLLFIVSIFSFLANGALFGPSVYTNYLAEQFQKTANEISHLVTYPNLLFGFGEMPFSGITSPYAAANGVDIST